MEPSEVRPNAGRQEDVRYRVDLTRHCLTSGVVRLPIALRDRFPEGELLATCEQGERHPLTFRPPRDLAGLEGYFERCALQPNDALELRIDGDNLRIAAAARPRPDRDRSGNDRALSGGDAPPRTTAKASVWTSYREAEPRRTPSRQAAPLAPTPAGAPPAGGSEAGADGDDAPTAVIERIGSVTIRRLGRPATAGPSPSEPVQDEELAREAAQRDGAGRSAATLAGATPAGATPAGATPAGAKPAGATLADAPAAGPAQAEPTPLFAPDDEPAADGDALLISGPASKAEPTPLGSESTHWFVTEADLADPSDGVREERFPRRVLGRLRDSTRSEQVRRQAVSRAGDLRSRVVRWFLDPDTPVIVPFERVEHAFDLAPDTARAVIEGLLEDPPPSLRLTALRDGIVRVSRVTVTQEDDALR